MQVHTFIADSASEAVERIRAELGPSAVVLSVRKLPRNGLDRFIKHDQIEVLASIDEPALITQRQLDPLAELREEVRLLRAQITAAQVQASSQPLAEPQIPRRRASSPAAIAETSLRGVTNSASPISTSPNPKPSGIAHLLAQTGLLPAYAEFIAQEISAADTLPISEQIARASDSLARRWRGEPPQAEASVHAFVGVPGSGKSTVLCKMLAQTSLVEGQPATVYQLDSHIANVSSLPGVYSEIVGAHFERSVPLQFERREESVFVDLPGVPLHNTKALAQLQDLIPSFGMPEIHLVLNGAYESPHLLEQVRFFSALGIADLIVTHMDEESRWGKLWNLLLGTNFSIRSLACGQNIPGEFHTANPETILARQFPRK